MYYISTQREDMNTNTKMHPLKQSRHICSWVSCAYGFIPFFCSSSLTPQTWPNRWLAVRTDVQNKQHFLKGLALLCWLLCHSATSHYQRGTALIVETAGKGRQPAPD